MNTRSERQQLLTGFSLVEMIIALAIVTILVGAAVPAFQNVVREHEAREPVKQVAEMARTVRSRAMRLQRPYQVGFDESGCYAAPYSQPYQQTEEYEELKREIEARQAGAAMTEAAELRFGDAAEADEPDPDQDFLMRYDWPDNTTVRVRFWGQAEWQTLGGAEFERWVFQPSGLCRPLVLQFESDGVFFEARFSPLTAEIEEEKSYVE